MGPNLTPGLGLMVSDKKIFKDFKKNSVLLPWQPEFLKESDDNSKLDENVRKFSKRVENTVGKGEIARYDRFLLFPQCFQKTCTADT